MADEPARKRKRLWMGIAVLLLVTGGVGAFAYLQGTPLYSLFQLRNALVNRDAQKVFRYVDVDLIVEHYAERLAARQQQTESANTWDKIVAGLMKGPSRTFLAPIKEALKIQVVNIIETADDDLLRELKVISIFALKIERTNDGAWVSLRDDPGKKVRMERQPQGHWKIVELILPNA